MFVFISIVRIYDAIRYHDMICDAIKRNDMYYIWFRMIEHRFYEFYDIYGL